MSDNRFHNLVNSFLDRISSNVQKIMAVVAAFTVLYPVLNYIYDLRYKIDCEKFFNIPAKYFSRSIHSNMIFLAAAILLAFAAMIPYLKQRRERKNNTLTKFNLIHNILISIVLGVLLGAVNVLYLIEIVMDSTLPEYIISVITHLFMTLNEWLLILIVISFFTLGLLGLLFSYKIKHMKKVAKMLLSVALAIVLVVNLLIIVGGITAKFTESIPQKTRYEIVSIKNEQFIVLSDYENKKLVVKFDILDNNGQKTYTFKTNEYFFIDPDECTFSYIDTIYPPTIKK